MHLLTSSGMWQRMAHFVMGIPEDQRTGRFTTHFMPNMTKQVRDGVRTIFGDERTLSWKECEKLQMSEPFSAAPS